MCAMSRSILQHAPVGVPDRGREAAIATVVRGTLRVFPRRTLLHCLQPSSRLGLRRSTAFDRAHHLAGIACLWIIPARAALLAGGGRHGNGLVGSEDRQGGWGREVRTMVCGARDGLYWRRVCDELFADHERLRAAVLDGLRVH